MANKISTVRTYPLNGAVDFTITFEYLARKFVRVTLIGKDRKELVLNQDYRFTTKTQITTSRAWTAADGYQMIEIRRFTSASDRLVDFADGSILRAYDLNISQIQTLHVADEARDLTADTIGVNNDGNLDARGRRIVNVADPVDEYDALNLRTVKQWNDGAYQSYVKALSEADRAKSEADRAQQEATKANNFAVHSEQYGIRSENAAARSETARDRAISAETNSASSAQKALTSEGQAAAHNDASRQSRIKAEEARDRAIIEANKLGNMNDFAGALESVDGNNVTFKGEIRTTANIVGGDLISNGAGHFERGVAVNGDSTAYVDAPPNPAIGQYLNATAVRSQLRGRGALSDPLGAYCGMYIQERVGTDHAIILNLNGYSKDTNWQLYSNGKISTPLGDVMTSGSDVRIKDDFTKPLDGAGERIDAIGIVEYTEIATGERKRGWVAQQLDMIDPLYTYLTANAEGSLLNTNDRAMLADVITELQALRQRVKELEG